MLQPQWKYEPITPCAVQTFNWELVVNFSWTDKSVSARILVPAFTFGEGTSFATHGSSESAEGILCEIMQGHVAIDWVSSKSRLVHCVFV